MLVKKCRIAAMIVGAGIARNASSEAQRRNETKCNPEKHVFCNAMRYKKPPKSE